MVVPELTLRDDLSFEAIVAVFERMLQLDVEILEKRALNEKKLLIVQFSTEESLINDLIHLAHSFKEYVIFACIKEKPSEKLMFHLHGIGDTHAAVAVAPKKISKSKHKYNLVYKEVSFNYKS